MTSPARGGQNSVTSTGVSSPRSTGTVQYSTVQYSTVQSPVHRFYDKTDLKDLDNFFNWSMTYRLDSDFPVPYGDIQQVEYLPYRRRAMRIIYFLLFSRWSLYLREMN